MTLLQEASPTVTVETSVAVTVVVTVNGCIEWAP